VLIVDFIHPQLAGHPGYHLKSTTAAAGAGWLGTAAGVGAAAVAALSVRVAIGAGKRAGKRNRGSKKGKKG
jgi:hypothetical protein